MHYPTDLIAHESGPSHTQGGFRSALLLASLAIVETCTSRMTYSLCGAILQIVSLAKYTKVRGRIGII
jgi:hypothetical protein